MESLNQRVQTLFLDKHKYRDIDYIRIMNQLKETYLKLTLLPIFWLLFLAIAFLQTVLILS